MLCCGCMLEATLNLPQNVIKKKKIVIMIIKNI